MEIPEGMNLVDEAYLEKMAAFEVDCNDGKGEPAACHHVEILFRGKGRA